MAELTVGWIGLGIMGWPMASNLRRAGFDVKVFNRTRTKAETWARDGGRVAESPGEAAAGRDVVITMVSDTPDVEAVVFGPDGVCSGLRPGLTIIDMSTISPAATRRFSEAIASRGGRWVDAPVSGGEGGALAGTLSIMVGGDLDVVARCRPILTALGQRITHMGPPGSGQATKLCNQVVALGNLLATCEGMHLAASFGLDPTRLLEALGGGAAGSWQLQNLGPKIRDRDFAPGFLVRLARKDLRLVLEAAAQKELALPGVDLVANLFSTVADQGDDGLGTQSLMTALERNGSGIDS